MTRTRGIHIAATLAMIVLAAAPFLQTLGFDLVWDDAHLDAYLTNPQTVIPGSMMPYKQAKPPVRQAIIAYLKEQH